jgi:hypothetical protein
MSIGRWSIRHPRKAVAAWVTVVIAAIALGAISGTKTLDNGAVGESARGYTIMNEFRLWGPGRELAYIHAPREAVPQSAIRDVERRFRALGLTPERKVSASSRRCACRPRRKTTAASWPWSPSSTRARGLM